MNYGGYMNNDFSEARKGRILIVLTALLWGLAGVCVKSISWGSMSIMFVRSLISLVLLFTVKRSFKVVLSRTNFLGAALMSATGLLYVEAIKLTTAGTAIVLQYIAPILVLLFSVIFRKRKISITEIIITVAVFLGCVLSFADNMDIGGTLGNIFGLLSGFTFAGQIIVLNDKKSESDDCLILSNIISLFFSLPFLFFDNNISLDYKNVFWLLILGVFQYGLANVLFSKGIKKLDSVEVSLLLTLEPIFNPIPVAIICGEKMGRLAVTGFIIVIFFVTLYGILSGNRNEDS